MRSEEQKEKQKNLFFELLNLHNSKTQNVRYDKEVGDNAFKVYAKIANDYLMYYILLGSLKKGHQVDDICESEFFRCVGNIYNLNDRAQILERMQMSDIARINFKEFILEHLDDIIFYLAKEMTIDEKLKSLGYVYKLVYNKYGHILGQYFRNMFYILDVIDNNKNFNDDEKMYYAHIFRAQLSRYELALGFFNAVWERSSKRMIKILLKYEILDDLYYSDIAFFNKSKTINVYSRAKEILEYALNSSLIRES